MTMALPASVLGGTPKLELGHLPGCMGALAWIPRLVLPGGR